MACSYYPFHFTSPPSTFLTLILRWSFGFTLGSEPRCCSGCYHRLRRPRRLFLRNHHRPPRSPIRIHTRRTLKNESMPLQITSILVIPAYNPIHMPPRSNNMYMVDIRILRLACIPSTSQILRFGFELEYVGYALAQVQGCVYDCLGHAERL